MGYTLIPGKTHEVGTAEETLEMVRSVLSEDLSRMDENGTDDVTSGGKQRKSAERFVDIGKSAEDEISFESEKLSRRRPIIRLIALTAVLTLAYVRPTWVIVPLLLVTAFVAGLFAFLGAERIWTGVFRWLKRIEGRDPERARRMCKRLDVIAYRWDGFLDLFPASMTGPLYMPNFQSAISVAERHEAVLADRYARLQQEAY